MNILVTGGTGHLGRAIVASLKDDGHDIRVLARRPSSEIGILWIRGDLATSEGITAAVRGTEVVIHAATHSPAAQRGAFRLVDFVRSPTDVDVRGTAALLDAAHKEGVRHFIYVSIAGLPSMARLSAYARVKIAAEKRVRRGPVPWSIVRATEFYWLLDRMLATLTRRPVLRLPADVRMQPVDSSDFARFVAATVSNEERGERRDFVGPQALTLRELAEQYLAARQLERRIRNVALPRWIRTALEAGGASSNVHAGATTWAEWLRRERVPRPPRPSQHAFGIGSILRQQRSCRVTKRASRPSK